MSRPGIGKSWDPARDIGRVSKDGHLSTLSNASHHSSSLETGPALSDELKHTLLGCFGIQLLSVWAACTRGGKLTPAAHHVRDLVDDSTVTSVSFVFSETALPVGHLTASVSVALVIGHLAASVSVAFLAKNMA